jgi:CheY-like chemotaxis protein
MGRVQVELVQAGGLWTILVDPNQLENALLNLCINARDAMPDGGRLTITTLNMRLDPDQAGERGLEPGDYVTVGVGDTGVGIAADDIERVFEPFFTTKPTGRGTGLGLSMVYGFARQSNGLVRIRSTPGEGTLVRLYLPRHEAIADAADDAALQVRRPARPGLRALVVDDEPTVRMMMVDALGLIDIECLDADDGPAALALLDQGVEIDLLVTDVGLPGGLNGRQVADEVRRRRPDVAVLFVTGYADSVVLQKDDGETGIDVLTKPFTLDDLQQRALGLVEKVKPGC